MKIAISNIAWDPSEDEDVAAALEERGIDGIEIAPTKVWPMPLEVGEKQARRCQKWWASRGARIVAVQSLLFGHPELKIFADAETRERTFDYLSGVTRLASVLGAGVLVFGSPSNRAVGDLDPVRALDIAAEFFRRLGSVAHSHNVCFCIEPNAPAYGCDFIRTANEACNLVRMVDSPGFRIHLDAGNMTMNGEDYGRAIEQAFPWLAHFHASEPNLAVVGRGASGHDEIARRLRFLGYQGWVSIEMRTGATAPNTLAVKEALDLVKTIYGD